MLREGAGEKLEEIAAEYDFPAPRVRSVSRGYENIFASAGRPRSLAVAVVGSILLGILAVIVRLRNPRRRRACRHRSPCPSIRRTRFDARHSGPAKKASGRAASKGRPRAVARSSRRPGGNGTAAPNPQRAASARAGALQSIQRSPDLQRAGLEVDGAREEAERNCEEGKGRQGDPQVELESSSAAAGCPKPKRAQDKKELDNLEFNKKK